LEPRARSRIVPRYFLLVVFFFFLAAFFFITVSPPLFTGIQMYAGKNFESTLFFGFVE